jgi:hypothetical protein
MSTDSPQPEQNQTARAPRTPRQQSQAEWAFAAKPDGTLVFRNWYFLVATIGIAILLALTGVLIFLVPIPAWMAFLEWKGVELNDGRIIYPVRLGLPLATITEVPPLFRKTLDLSEVQDAATATIRHEKGDFIQQYIRVANLTGEFGAAKIVFDSKAGRDRLFAVLKKQFPHINIHRWT